MDSQPTPSSAPTRGRGRGKSRGGLGKYLRARGRGRGYGRPAEFNKRLLLEGEGPQDDEEEAEEAAERAAKYSRRQLGTNADRYAEPEPELDSDGEPIVEPEVDLSNFLERQRISDLQGPSVPGDIPQDDADDIDTSLAHISSHPINRSSASASKKGKVEQIAWDEQLDAISREKAAAEATWELKSRFKAKSERLRVRPTPSVGKRKVAHDTYVEAPALPLPDGVQPKPKDEKEDMQDFLDDLLS